MAFKDIRFPPAISFSAVGGPRFSTTVVMVDSGYETATQNWTLELGRWEVGHDARVETQWSELLAFFRVVYGRGHTFRFKDWLDYTCTAAQGRFVMLTPTTFQLYKYYHFGPSDDSPADNYYYRKITKPISQITVTGGSGVSVNYATGVVTVSSGTPTSWYGEFDVHARLDTDDARFNIIDKKGDGTFIVGWQSIPIVEVRD